MRFYRYVIYKLYSWGRERSNTPITNVVITLAFVHFVQLLTVYMVILNFFPELNILSYGLKFYHYILGVLFVLAHYFIFYNKKRWDSYVKEFGNETLSEKKRGAYCVIAYFAACILLFFGVVIFLFEVVR